MPFRTNGCPMTSAFFRTAFFCLLFLAPAMAQAQDGEGWRHGGTLFGPLKYGPGFTHYEHANPDAPKGGTLNEDALGTFDPFNPFVVRGQPAAGLNYFGGLLWDTLMEQSIDQPAASYGLVAEAFRFPEDYSSATYRLRPEARFHDGAPITPEDVLWTLQALRENYPLYAQYYRNVAKAEKTGEREVTFTFDIKGNRELPHILGDMPVLPKHWWEGTDGKGAKRNIAEPTSEPPLGSGPYRIASFDSGKSVTWERVKDYWAADLPTRKGRYNFDRIVYTYFLDENALWEGFKKGGELQAGTGRPEGRMKEILEEYRGRIPDAAIDEPFELPLHANAGDTRRYQREALKLFTEAGYSFKGGRMLGPDGKQFEIEILGSGQTDERVGIPMIDFLAKLGIKAGLRIVDQAQYKNRIDNFDFEMTMSTTGQSLSPGNEQREYWTSKAADTPGSRNYSGIKDPVVDELVERIITAADRAELVALTRALDRILLANWYAIPMWHNPEVWFAWWKKLVVPPTQPAYSGVDIYSWWVDGAAEKAAGAAN
jgi:ABC-type oligopeptide transport system substrate-binding subunit